MEARKLSDKRIESNYPLVTKLLKNDVNIKIDIHVENLEPRRYHASIWDGEMSIGYVIYNMNNEEKLYIEYMENTIPYQYSHVGTALHEFTFRESCALGRGGHIEHMAAWNSHLFHYRFGFRAQPTYHFMHGEAWNKSAMNDALNALIELGCPKSCTNFEAISKIEKTLFDSMDEYEKEDYTEAKEEYAEKLKTTVEKVSFADLMFHYFFEYDFINNKLKKLSSKTKPGEKVDTQSMTTVFMYLTDEIILAKKKIYGIDISVLESENPSPALGNQEQLIKECMQSLHTEKLSGALFSQEKDKRSIVIANAGIHEEDGEPSLNLYASNQNMNVVKAFIAVLQEQQSRLPRRKNSSSFFSSNGSFDTEQYALEHLIALLKLDGNPIPLLSKKEMTILNKGQSYVAIKDFLQEFGEQLAKGLNCPHVSIHFLNDLFGLLNALQKLNLQYKA